MTETVLALVPTYGLWLVFGCLVLSCLALPAPSSIVVMAAGGFAAAGDMTLWQLQLAAFAGFVLGDQLAYGLARRGGTRLVDRLKRRAAIAAPLVKAERMLQKYGVHAVFLSRTIFSPLGPWIGYLSGAFRLRWLLFTISAVPGAVVWCTAYSLLGYYFALRINQIASLIGNGLGLVLTVAGVAGLAVYLGMQWRAQHKSRDLGET